MIIPVILSGGAGSRLWPFSRELYPKQFLPLVGRQTMLQDTVARLTGIPDLGNVFVVCNESHRFLVAEQLRNVDVNPGAIILEPIGRNTAPAVTVAALLATDAGSDPILLVLPADHNIADSHALRTTIENGIELVDTGKLVTFGIVPTTPETGYGYIKTGATLKNGINQQTQAFSVSSFVEKPDLTSANFFLKSGGYFWNSGMFMFRASTYLHELKCFAPEVLTACQKAVSGAKKDLDFTRLDIGAFTSCPGISIDYAVMEKTSEAVVIPLNAGWSDVGSWSALYNLGHKDSEENNVKGDVVLQDVHRCYLNSNSRIVAAVGIEDIIVVETKDAVLVANRKKDQDVKFIFQKLKNDKRLEALLHRKVSRPWGDYECIDQAERYQVKRITVRPGASLSLQLHHHRAEHWIVVRGTARIIKGDEKFLLTENQSTFIPLGVTHRLENPGKIPLEMIEVQSGSYLGEDDIVRFDDYYGRE